MAQVDLKSLSDEALVHHELRLERELIDASFRHQTSQLDDTSRLKKLRRGIARARTEERSRERANGLNTDALRNTHRGSFTMDQGGALASAAEASSGFLKGIAGKLGIGEDGQGE